MMDRTFTFKLTQELLKETKEKAGFRPLSDVIRSLLENWVKLKSNGKKHE